MSFVNPFTSEHDMFRKTVSDFVQKEVIPNAEEWEENKEIPRGIFRKLGDLGCLGVRYDPQYGGSGLDFWYTLILCEELAKSTYIGVGVSALMQCEMAAGAIQAHGSEELKDKYLTAAISGDLLGCLGISEPNAGSDVSAIRATAVLDGDSYIINGSKTFITNGGVCCSATAELTMEECVVPKANLLGRENDGFRIIMEHFQGERLVLCGLALGAMDAMMNEAITYGRDREVFGRPLTGYQVWRHRLADLATKIAAARQLTYMATEVLNTGQRSDLEISMAKLYTASLVKEVAGEVLQLHGGYGYMEEYPICRMYRDVAAFTIGAGTNEVMREIIAKQSIF